MNRAVGGVAVVAGAAAGGVAVRRIRTARHERVAARDRQLSRWRVVTIFRPADEVAPGGRPPAPLAELGDLVEVMTRPAPGDKGTELGARLRMPEPAGARAIAVRLSRRDPRYALRRALRHAKQLVETGEILRSDWPPSNKRTLTGRGLDALIRRSQEEGLL